MSVDYEPFAKLMTNSPGKPKPNSRSLIKLFDATGEVAWIIDSDHLIAWVSDACAAWLGVSSASLVGRSAVASTISDDALDKIAADLAAPLGLHEAGCMCVNIQGADNDVRAIRFFVIGTGPLAITIATSGKPIPIESPDSEANELLRMQSRIQQWRKRDAAWGGIVAAGSSRASKRLRSQIQLATVSPLDFSIIGPPGCGGEAIARRIHARAATVGEGTRTRQAPFFAIDGPLMDSELLEASLSPVSSHLGGATEDKLPQAIMIVVRGLDETPLDVQQQLEQFLCEHPTSVRMVGLLSDSVEACQNTGTVILAMAARLEALSLRIEPLATRVDDIALIASAIVDARHAAGQGNAERLSRAALDRLILYPWPGNFDELDAAMRHALASCRGNSIGAEHLPLAVRSYQPHEAKRQDEFIVDDLDKAMQRYELRLIQAAVEASGGNRSEAARKLGISRARLIRRLDENGPQAPQDKD